MIDYSRAEAELDELGYSAREKIREATLNVLYSLDAQDLSREDARAVASLVSHLVLSEDLLSETLGTWKPFKLGSVKPGAIVRVRWDAYDSETGQQHNGLVGVFTGAFGGRCTIKYVGRKDKLDFSHPPKLLEVLSR